MRTAQMNENSTINGGLNMLTKAVGELKRVVVRVARLRENSSMGAGQLRIQIRADLDCDDVHLLSSQAHRLQDSPQAHPAT